jgi:hypothetical protein
LKSSKTSELSTGKWSILFLVSDKDPKTWLLLVFLLELKILKNCYYLSTDLVIDFFYSL